MAIINQNLIQEEIKRRLNSGNACYHSVQDLLSSCLLSKHLKFRICRTIILPVVLYGSLTLRVSENRVLRRIFGPKGDEVTGGWRKLPSEELHDLYSSPSIIRIMKSKRMKWAGHAARMGEKRNVCRLLEGKPEGKRLLERPRPRWMDNIKIDPVEIEWDGVDWIDLAHDRNKWTDLVMSIIC
jgi:hypothetical protein